MSGKYEKFIAVSLFFILNMIIVMFFYHTLSAIISLLILCAIWLYFINKDPIIMYFSTIGSISAIIITIISFMLSGVQFSDREVSQFIIGESDSLFYHTVGVQVSETVDLMDQLSIWDLSYLKIIESQFGYGIQNFGYYWFLGMLYSAVGVADGPFIVMAINIMSLSTSLAIVVRQLKFNPNSDSDIPSYLNTVIISVFFFGDPNVNSLVVSLRKDSILTLLFISSLYFYKNAKYIFGSVFLGVSLVFRKILIVNYFLLFLMNYTKVKRYIFYDNARIILIIIFVLLTIPFICVNNSEYLVFLFYGSIVDINMMSKYSAQVGGVEILLMNWFLNWIYVLAMPFPPLGGVSTMEFINGLRVFLVNVVQLYVVWTLIIRGSFSIKSSRYNSGLQYYLLVLILLYAGFAFIVSSSIALNVIGAIEPRYKLSIWIIQYGFLVFYLSRAKSGANPS